MYAVKQIHKIHVSQPLNELPAARSKKLRPSAPQIYLGISTYQLPRPKFSNIAPINHPITHEQQIQTKGIHHLLSILPGKLVWEDNRRECVSQQSHHTMKVEGDQRLLQEGRSRIYSSRFELVREIVQPISSTCSNISCRILLELDFFPFNELQFT